LLRHSDAASAGLVERRHVMTGWNPEADADYANLIDRVLAGPPTSSNNL
jgi:hypothetical protein